MPCDCVAPIVPLGVCGLVLTVFFPWCVLPRVIFIFFKHRGAAQASGAAMVGLAYGRLVGHSTHTILTSTTTECCTFLATSGEYREVVATGALLCLIFLKHGVAACRVLLIKHTLRQSRSKWLTCICARSLPCLLAYTLSLM